MTQGVADLRRDQCLMNGAGSGVARAYGIVFDRSVARGVALDAASSVRSPMTGSDVVARDGGNVGTKALDAGSVLLRDAAGVAY